METNFDPVEARRLLDDEAGARHAMAATIGTPRWITLVMSADLGVFVVGCAERWWWLVGLTGIVAVALLVAEHRVRRRRGRIVDARSVGANFAIFAGFYVVLVVVQTLLRDHRPPLWAAGLGGLACAAASFAYLTLHDRYQRRRILRGDYTPVDMV